MANTNKPLAIRMLEQRKIPHEVFAFDDSVRSADGVAAHTGSPPHLVYKTLVVELDPPRGKPYLVMVPADSQIELKILATSVGVKSLRMALQKDAERHTGLQVGGISALALLGRGFTVLIDERAMQEDAVLVSAGQRGYDVRLKVTDLVALTAAKPVKLSSAGASL